MFGAGIVYATMRRDIVKAQGDANNIGGREVYFANQLPIAEKAIESLELLLLGLANES